MAGELGIYHMYGNVYEWCRNCDNKIIAFGGSYRTTNIKKFLSVERKHDQKFDNIGFRICRVSKH